MASRQLGRSMTVLLIASMFVGGRCAADQAAKTVNSAIDWQPWSDAAFATAKKENRLVLLDLHAVWCHWCHVMDDTTYSDPKVIALIKSHYVAIGVDQDSRPDLSNRYEDYGWPATVVFDAEGHEIVKRQGYVPPEQMASLLQAIIDDPTPGPSVVPDKAVAYAKEALLSGDFRAELEKAVVDGYDEKLGGWGDVHKWLDWDSVEYLMTRAAAGDEHARAMAIQTLNAQLKLIDPVWGGVDQYSAEGDWDHPHYEKIMQMQAEDMRIYSLAYAQFGDPAYLKAATDIHRFVRQFLTSPDGAFYTSQDADPVPGEQGDEYFKLDDAGRRQKGIPRVDTHIYARENGWMINALVELYAVTGDESYLEEADRAAKWIIEHRLRVSTIPRGKAGPDEVFSHGVQDPAGPYLGDSLAMGRAFLSLYTATSEHGWLDWAEWAAGEMGVHFQDPVAGFATADLPSAGTVKPKPEFDENVTAARFLNLLSHYSGNAWHHDLAACALRYLVTPDVARSRQAFVGGALMAESEFGKDPLHITVVGPKADPAGRALFLAALRYPVTYKQLECWDPKAGNPAPGGIEYPELATAAAFLCTNRSCSAPISKSEDLAPKIERMMKR